MDDPKVVSVQGDVLLALVTEIGIQLEEGQITHQDAWQEICWRLIKLTRPE